MKHQILVGWILIDFCSCVLAQTDPQLTWINGSDLIDQSGVYGTNGIGSNSNIPGARENAMSWTDVNDNLWLFGGHGNGTGTSQGYLNDLWKFDVITEQWIWISGDSVLGTHGVYGTLGVASSANFPGARQNSYTWVDESGNLWLFGGFGYAASGVSGYLNDLWKYDVISNQWIWISGSAVTGQVGNYGSIGISDLANVPGARYGGSAWYLDNKLWLFGGQGFSTTQERYNDLWIFDLLTNEWTWISGSDMADQNGNYGTMGVTSATSVPGARQASSAWTDQYNTFWIYGGYGYPETGTKDYLNDLWKYESTTNQWTWVSGSNTINQPAVYGTQGTGSITNSPGARQMSIAEPAGNNELWIFSAWGHCGFTGGASFGRLNDLWKYETAWNEWTWMGGSNMPDESGTYGTAGVADASNIPGARRMSVSWSDSSGDIWLFGGNGYDVNGNLGLLNDLWKIDVPIIAGVSQNQDAVLKVYPTLFSDVVTIECNDSDEREVMITDQAGRVVYTNKLSGKESIDLSFLADGIYFICMNGNAVKVVKTK